MSKNQAFGGVILLACVCALLWGNQSVGKKVGEEAAASGDWVSYLNRLDVGTMLLIMGGVGIIILGILILRIMITQSPNKTDAKPPQQPATGQMPLPTNPQPSVRQLGASQTFKRLANSNSPDVRGHLSMGFSMSQQPARPVVVGAVEEKRTSTSTVEKALASGAARWIDYGGRTVLYMTATQRAYKVVYLDAPSRHEEIAARLSTPQPLPNTAIATPPPAQHPRLNPPVPPAVVVEAQFRQLPD